MKTFPILFAVAALASPAAAFAQADDGGVAAVVACVADNAPNDSRKLLATLPGSREEAKAGRRLSDSFTSCGSRISPRTDEFAGTRAALALAIVQGGAARASAISATPWYASVVAGRTAGTDYDIAAISRQRFGTCVAAAMPDAAARLVAAAAASAEERAAVAALKPVLGGCIVQGQTLKLTPSNLRLMLAEPLYHAISG